MIAVSRGPRAAALVLAAAVAAAFGQSVYRIPVQVSDCVDAIVAARASTSTWTLLRESSRWSETTLRPMRYVQARWLAALADGSHLSYHAAFRGTHVVLTCLLVALFVWTASVRAWTDAAAFAFALLVFTGLHTFGAMLREAFPVNHFALVAVAALMVVAMARQAPRTWRQVAMLVALVWTLLLVELGVLVWLVIVACVVVKLPGVGRVTALVATVVLVIYFAARPALGISSPGIGSHDSGFGGTYRSASELQARFGDHPLPFYAYNVAGGALSVLASEPRFGVYQLATARQREALSPVVPINIVASLLTTALIAWYGLTSLRRPPAEWSTEQRLLVVAAVVIAAGAGLCVTYMKDEILSVSGAFYAIAAYVAMRGLLMDAVRLRGVVVPVMALVVVTAASLWAFRAVGVHFELRRMAFVTRNDWTRELVPADRSRWPSDPLELALRRRLKTEALDVRVASPFFLPRWGSRYWVE